MIDKAKFYKFIYVSVSFADSPNFAKGLKEKFPVEIPYLELDCLNTRLKESLDSYFYIEDTSEFTAIYKDICRKYPKISFTVLGSIRGKDVFSFFSACKKANTETLSVGDFVKVIAGELKNLTAKVSKVDGEQIEIEFPLLNTIKNADCHTSELLLQENYTPLELNKFRNMEKKHEKHGYQSVLIVDGNNCLLRSMRNTPDKYNSKGDFIGGFLGFFFSLLKVKEFYPEYKIYVAFQSSENIVKNFSEELRKAYIMNLMWCQLFTERLGFYCCYSPTEETKDIIGTLLQQLRATCKDILIYSTNEVFLSKIQQNVSVYYPKITYRGNSEFITFSRIPKLFGFKEPYKVKWALAFHGETEIPVKSISDFFIEKYGPKQGKIKYVEYSSFIFNNKTEEELIFAIQQDPNFSTFAETLTNNLQLLGIDTSANFTTVKLPYCAEEVISLLEEIEMYKEIELWDRTERIFQGLW